jgi:hypothetical protein
MNRPSTPSRRIGVGVLVVMLAACGALNAGVFWMLKNLSARLALAERAPEGANRLDALVRWATDFQQFFWPFFVPASILFFGLLGVLVWGIARRALVRAGLPAGAKRPAVYPEHQAEHPSKVRNDLDQRLFLHLLTVLQREGRMVDFFYEDLGAYTDTQIGTAVRSIHESCRKVIDKYLAPQAVVRENEGDEITVEEGFDASALKLTGNVIGEPPFKGTVRHRGWKVRKLDLPTLSGKPDPDIIAPAEIEVH